MADAHFMYGLADGNDRSTSSLPRIVPLPQDPGKEYVQQYSSASLIDGGAPVVIEWAEEGCDQ
jgi:hypothetical protein